MKILIVAQYFPPDITAAAFRIHDTARLLERGGHEVRVITAYPHRTSVNNGHVDEYDRQVSRVWRTRVAPLNGGGFLDYVRHYSSFTVGSSWLGLRQRLAHWRPDVIWASSPPLFVGLSGAALARIFRSPLVVDIRDIWPASAVGAGQLSADGPAYWFGAKMEQYVYDRASHITCVARPMQEYIGERTRTPVTVVYNGTRASDIVEADSDDGLENGRTLLYAGNLGRAQQLDLLIRAWARARDKDTARSWAVKFLGTGALEKDLRELAANLGVSNSIAFSKPVSRQEAIRQMSGAAALCVSLRADKAFERTIPSKVFDCMAVGKPVLAGVAGEARTILESTGANLCYEPGNQQSLEGAFEELVQDYPRRRWLARRNAQMVRSNYTREQAVRVLMNVFDDVVANGCGRPRVEGDFVIDRQGSP